jgi:hypothetical protein
VNINLFLGIIIFLIIVVISVLTYKAEKKKTSVIVLVGGVVIEILISFIFSNNNIIITVSQTTPAPVSNIETTANDTSINDAIEQKSPTSSIVTSSNNVINNDDIELGTTESQLDSVTQIENNFTEELSSKYMTDICPAYQCSNVHMYKEYSAINSGSTDSFSMGGVEYLNGFTMKDYTTWAVWNLNGEYNTLTGTFGHVDGAGSDEVADEEFRILYIYCDVELKQEIPFSTDMYPIELTIDLTGVKQLKILFGAKFHMGVTPTYGMGNPVLE